MTGWQTSLVGTELEVPTITYPIVYSHTPLSISAIITNSSYHVRRLSIGYGNTRNINYDIWMSTDTNGLDSDYNPIPTADVNDLLTIISIGY